MNRSLLFIALFTCTAAMADSASQVTDTSTIHNSGAGYTGNFNLNQAAGDQQQQANVRAIAIGTNASASTYVQQKLTTPADRSINASSSIGGNSFSNGNGVLGVNQSSGANNQMVNAMRISISANPQGIDDSVLSQQNVALLPSSGATDTHQGSRQVVTSDQAFTGSRGVIQVNQSAGVGNRMANTLSIRVAD